MKEHHDPMTPQSAGARAAASHARGEMAADAAIGVPAGALPGALAGAAKADHRDMEGLLGRLEHAHAAVLARNRALEERIRALEGHNRELEERIRGRDAALENARRDLESFAHSISHDLRAPLRAIGGFTDILLRDHRGRIPAEAAQLFERVLANVKRMSAMIEDLLELCRVGTQPLDLQPVDVAALVAECLEELGAESPGARLRLALGELPPCLADAGLLRRAVRNLLSNALKFSRGRDPACITVGAEVSGDRYLWHVGDNGVGFDMRMAHRLFQVFQRLHAQGEYAGSGTGLAIVRRIIERHGGRVWAKSAPDEGATFYFSLPAGGPPESAAP